MGFDFLLPNTKARMETAITGSGAFKICIRERLADWMMLRLTSEVNHSDNDFKFGIGMQIGPSAPKEMKTFDPLCVDRWVKDPVIKTPACFDWKN